MKNKLTYRQALSKAKYICSGQEKCSGDIRNYFNKYSMSEDNMEKVISILIKENYIDDKRYAEFYTEDKFRLNRWGRIKIRHGLRQKGISEEYIAKALNNIEEPEYFNSLKNLLIEKQRSLPKGSPQKTKGKLFRFAQGRGFETELIYKIIDSI